MQKSEIKKRIVVGMSGGVDSSVAVALLKKAGFDVVGVMMKFWTDGGDGKNRCCSVESEKMARLVAKKIGIPFYVVNVEKEFKKKVVDYFLAEYKAGRTPNPCVVCNKEIKFGVFIEKALKMGADFVATGHYALASSVKLFKAKDKNKYQSYFLYKLNKVQLSKVLFPIGKYTKTEVRDLAKKFDLPTAETKESQGICFVRDTTNNFLKKYLKQKPGKILDTKGKVVGEHLGLWFYTIGQRRGIGLGSAFAKGSGVTKPWYVVAKDFKKNILIISKDKKDLLKKEFFVKNVNWILPQKLPLNAEVKIRYKSVLAKAKIVKLGKNIKVIFQKPQQAVTPGQSAVFYKGQELLGGGTIE